MPTLTALRARSGMWHGSTRGVVLLAVGLVLLVQGGCVASPAPVRYVSPTPPRVLIFGDSYTEGLGATPETKGYAYLVGAPLGWDVTVDGVGGTGYIAVGPRGEDLGDYRTRLASAPAGPFDLVVLQGSSNDEREPIADLPQSLARTVPAFQARYPGARLVMMGPVPTFGPPTAVKIAVNEALRHYAATEGIAFIDPIAGSWFARGEAKRLVNPVNSHPNNAGYERIRDRFVIDATRLDLTPHTG